MGKEARGICPHCQQQTGDAGTPCPNPECGRLGYYLIPILSFDASKARAEKKGAGIEPIIGRRIDRYLMVGKAGEGGMGAVYIALQQPLNREVAVKIMPSIHLSPEALERFETEAKAVSALDHPNIVKLYDYGFGEIEGQRVPYMVLEYIKHGRTMKQLMTQEFAEHEVLRSELTLQIFEQVLGGLGAAHAVGIVHRDVKPENVMLTQIHGNPYYAKILDFGLATGLHGNSTGMTGSNQILGTPTYMAPEQIPSSRRQEIDLRTDLYAVGVMLFECMTGSRPFPGDTALAVLTAKSNEKFNPFDAPVAARLTKPQRAFLEKAISFDSDGRFQSAGEMLAALNEAIAQSGARKRGGLLGFMEDKLGTQLPGLGSRGPATPEKTNPPAGITGSGATPNPMTGMAMHSMSGMAQNPLAGMPPGSLSGMAQNPLAVQGIPLNGGPTPSTSPGIRRPARTTTNPIPAVNVTPGWQSQTSEIRRTGQSSMTPEERAERLRGRKRRTTGTHMARAVEAERAAAGTHDNRGLPTMLVVFGIIVAIIAVSVAVPRYLESRRIDRTQADLKDLRSSLVIAGKFVGLDSPVLRAGTQLDYFISDPGRPESPLLDAWGNPYRVRYSLQNPAGYVLYSTGSDGEKGTCDRAPGNDDICVELGMP